MTYRFIGLPEMVCNNLRSGAVDSNGQVPERTISDGGGNPCRCCLDDIPAGRDMLILGYRPFETLNPYAELGPIFLCAECAAYGQPQVMPPVLTNRARHLLKGYTATDRIVYGTGEIVETRDIPRYLDRVFADPLVRYVHVRSATNNCFTLRIDQQFSN